MAKVQPITTTVNVFRTNGEKVTLTLTLGAVKFSTYVRCKWGEIDCTLIGSQDGPKNLHIEAHEAKKHKVWLEKYFSAKLKAGNAVRVVIVNFAEYDAAIAEWQKTLDAEKATFEALAEKQPYCFGIYDFLDWGDYNITKHQDIIKYRLPMPEYEETSPVEVRRWHITYNDPAEWKADYEAATGGEFGVKNISTDVAEKWIRFHAEQNEAKAAAENQIVVVVR